MSSSAEESQLVGTYDNTLMAILEDEGQIEYFLDVVFSFVYRQTNFFRHTNPEIEFTSPEIIVADIFGRYMNLADQKRIIQAYNPAQPELGAIYDTFSWTQSEHEVEVKVNLSKKVNIYKLHFKSTETSFCIYHGWKVLFEGTLKNAIKPNAPKLDKRFGLEEKAGKWCSTLRLVKENDGLWDGFIEEEPKVYEVELMPDPASLEPMIEDLPDPILQVPCGEELKVEELGHDPTDSSYEYVPMDSSFEHVSTGSSYEELQGEGRNWCQ